MFQYWNLAFRYYYLHNPQLAVRLFTLKKVLIMFFGNVLMFNLLFIPFIVNSALGLEDLGMCGLKLSTLFLKIWFQIVIMYIFAGYLVSLFCGFKVIKKIRSHKKSVSTEFQVMFHHIFVFIQYTVKGNIYKLSWKSNQCEFEIYSTKNKIIQLKTKN